MTDCERILELLPWYVIGKLGVVDATAVAAHIQSCETCRRELAEVVWVRHTVGTTTFGMPGVRQRVWRRVMTKAGFRDTANVDIGSFLVGFRLGVNARRPGSPVRASLRVMGHNVRIVGTQRGGECETPKDAQ
ncbi:MAG: zf-HC2 domain-containing protein [bacterium]